MATRDHSEFKRCKYAYAVHTKLRSVLCTDYLVERNLDIFRMNCRLYLRNTKQKLLRTAWDIWDELEERGFIGVNKYGTLKELLDGIDVAMIDLIEEAEDKIKTLGTSQGDHGNKRKRKSADENKDIDEKPGKSRSGKSSSIPEVPKDAKYPMFEKKGHNTAEHPDRRNALPKYDVKERKRGKVLVFCNVSVQNCHDLDGYKKDAGKLQETFTALQFEVDILNNKNHECILNALQECRDSEIKEDQSAFICCFLSHGGSNADRKQSFILSSDGKAIYIEDVMAMFTHENCPSLVGKPKIFLVQACRGTEKNKDTVAANIEYTGTPHLIPNFSDYLLFNSTVLDYVSWVSTFDGSFFIRNFCEKMKEHHSEYDIMTICTLVTGAVAADGDKGFKQVPEIKSTLRKLLFL